MNLTTEQLLDAALTLPEDDRVQIAEALIASLQPADQPPFDESWREVIRRRSAEFDAGLVTPISWADVKERTRREVMGGG